MDQWLTPGIIIGLLANLVTIASLWGRMNANMSNFGDKMSSISNDVHDMRNTIVELGKLAAKISEQVNGHERQITKLDDRISGSNRLP